MKSELNIDRDKDGTRQFWCENNRHTAQFFIVDRPYKNMLNVGDRSVNR
jgi:hypothetical protein